MKKKILLFMMVILAFAVVSCGSATGPAEPSGSNPFVGEWYEVGSTEARGRRVVFTDTSIDAWYYISDYVDVGGTVEDWKEIWFDNVKYSFGDDTLMLLNENGSFPLKTPFEFHSNDALEIQHFIPTALTIPSPNNFEKINLFR